MSCGLQPPATSNRYIQLTGTSNLTCTESRIAVAAHGERTAVDEAVSRNSGERLFGLSVVRFLRARTFL